MSAAGIVFVILAAGTVAFQLALAAGLPWGELTWGGKFPGVLPARMRAVAVFSALLLAAFSIIVAARSGYITESWVPGSRSLIWVVVAYCAVGVVANAATPSKWERRVWLPVVVAMLCSSLLVATSA